jgi:AAA family ATP:ADP antiporter
MVKSPLPDHSEAPSDRSWIRKITSKFGFLYERGLTSTRIWADASERRKCLFLCLLFFLVIGAFTLVKELQSSVFTKVVGVEYVPLAKMLTMIALLPIVFLYSYLVDYLTKYKLLAFFSVFYSVLGVVLGLCLGHPQMGLPNTDADPYRFLGWIFYFYVEGFQPYIVGVFWAFCNAINQPNEARRTYSLIVASSKTGGMLSAGFAYFLMEWPHLFGWSLDMVVKQQILLVITGVLLLFVPVVIYYMRHAVDDKHFLGYRADLRVKKEESPRRIRTGVWAGLKLLISRPYVLAIFGMVFFFELINQVLNYQRLVLADKQAAEICALNAILYKQIFFVHFTGFFLSLFGTSFFMRVLGVGRSLLLMPIASLILILGFVISGSIDMLLIAYIGLHSANYTLNIPVRESLYILASKDIQFKSKSWIDSFGTKFAKSMGQQFNLLTNLVQAQSGLILYTLVNNIFLIVVLILWLVTSVFLGRRYQQAIRKNELIE